MTAPGPADAADGSQPEQADGHPDSCVDAGAVRAQRLTELRNLFLPAYRKSLDDSRQPGLWRWLSGGLRSEPAAPADAAAPASLNDVAAT